MERRFAWRGRTMPRAHSMIRIVPSYLRVTNKRIPSHWLVEIAKKPQPVSVIWTQSTASIKGRRILKELHTYLHEDGFLDDAGTMSIPSTSKYVGPTVLVVATFRSSLRSVLAGGGAPPRF